MPGRLRTASKPLRTLMESAPYSAGACLSSDMGISLHYFVKNLRNPGGNVTRLPQILWLRQAISGGVFHRPGRGGITLAEAGVHRARVGANSTGFGQAERFTMITCYWAPRTRAGRMFWLLEEIGQPYRMRLVDIRSAPRPADPEFEEASPLHKVPALRDGAVKMADSAAIALYLADRYASGTLAPALDDPLRGEFLYWMFFVPSAMEGAMVEKIEEFKPRPTAYSWGSFDRMVGALETRLTGRDWLVGDAFTVADLMICSGIQAMANFRLLDLSETFSAYIHRCRERPAHNAAVAREALETAAADGVDLVVAPPPQDMH
ncbi:MAG: hypothetical protein CML65_08225 [Rhodobacteraceae bacterium]|nr:hypothetical protein [Paracoccaceae bacterium]